MALLFISLTEPNSDVFLKNPDGSQYLGQVWPGYTVRYESRSRDAVRSHIEQFLQVFPDWFANNTQLFWTEGLRNWSQSGVNYSGIWLDMNEPSSFCIGSW